jgi:nucleotide-binding universal stress UspA family protein
VLENTATSLHRIDKNDGTENVIISETDYKELIKKDIESKWSDEYRYCSKYEIRVTAGLPWEEIVKWARETGSHFIVLGPHEEVDKKKRAARPVRTVGSTIEGVVRREPCPVMIVNRLMPDEMLDFKKLVVCVDFSISCSYALKFAIEISQNFHSMLFIFHMLPIPPSPEYTQTDYQRNRQISEEKLEEFCKDIPDGIDFEYSVRGGAFPHLEVLEYAKRKSADLIVMGSHTKESNGKWYVGSAVERVGCRSLCPVIVVSDPIALLT